MEISNLKYTTEFFESKKINLIVNADDIGLCHERDEGIFQLFDNKCISSGSILINGDNFENSIRIAKEKKLPLGIHINLTEGRPILNEVNSLVKFDESNKVYTMHGKFGFREKLKNKEINETEIKAEIISQVKY